MATRENNIKVFQAKNRPFCVQKCYMPDNVFGKYGWECVALMDVSESFKVIAKLRENDPTLPVNCCFLDASVIVPKKHWNTFNLEDAETERWEIGGEDIKPITSVSQAEKLEIIVVCSSVGTVIKLKENTELCEKLLKDFLKQFLVASGCIVLGSVCPDLMCHCVVITGITGKSADAYRITKSTKVVVKQVISLKMFKHLGTEAAAPKLFDENQIILSKVANVVKRAIGGSKIRRERNVLIAGASGCGKSSMIEWIAGKLGRIVLSVACGEKSSSEELSKIIETAKNHVKAQEPCIIVLKDVERLCTSRNDELTMNSKIMIKEIISHLETIRNIQEIAVIATTSRPEEVNSMLKRFGIFSQEIEVPMLNEQDREYIFRHLSPTYGFSETCAKLVARWTPGYVLGDFHFLFREAQNLFDDFKDEVNCFKRAVSATLPSSLRGTRGLITSHRITFNDIGGLENVKHILKRSVLWQMTNPDAFARFGIPPTKGILLYGPPGCAKTTLVKALAFESNATFLAVSAADIYSCYVGEAEKRISQLFSQARIAAPSILFIDEIDALVGNKNGDRDRGPQERILATLLLEMDGVGLVLQTSDSLKKIHEKEASQTTETQVREVNNSQVIVVGATNRPEMIDDALKRPGRFDKLVYVPPPNIDERLLILQQITATMPLAASVDLKYIAGKTNLCSGADLKSVCTESALHALTNKGMDVLEITQSDFDHVIHNFRPSLCEKSFGKPR